MKTTLNGLLLLTVLLVSTAHAAIDPAKVQKLLASDAAALQEFGFSVAVSGDTVVIGGPYPNFNGKVGSAYVFVRSADGTWSEQVKLTAADGADRDEFGGSVAVSGDTAIIGTPQDDDKGDNSGSAYVFVRSVDGTWSQQAKIIAADGGDNDYFSYSVAMSGDTAVIGAYGDDDKGSSSGSAYVFIRAADGTWHQHNNKLTAADGAADDKFGESVAMSGDTAVIGARGGFGKVSAYVFVRWAANCTWSEQAKLTAANGSGFGHSVAVSGDTAVIGVHGGFGKGSAYIYGSTAVRP